MKINVKNPQSGKILELEANPAENDKEPGWSVILPAGNSIFITLLEGKWEARHNEEIEPDFIKAIGEAINPFSGKQEKATDEKNEEQLFRQKKEAEFRNNDTENGDI